MKIKYKYLIICFISLLFFIAPPVFSQENSISDPSTQEEVNNADMGDEVHQPGDLDDSDINSSEENPDPDNENLDAGTAAASRASGENSSEPNGSNVIIPEVSVFNGDATASIPIVVPPGRAGLQPNIALTYSSSQKNGWIGIGWDLDVGSIQRSTKRGIDYTADDYITSEGGELIPRFTDWGNNHYGLKSESAFTIYYFNVATGGWEAHSKEGLIYFFGTTASSRQDDPVDSTKVFMWCVDKVKDIHGNFMSFSYTKDQGQIYLDRIDYTDNENSNLPTATNYVKYYLEDRLDKQKSYKAHFEVITAKRLKTIEVQSKDGTVKAYSIKYRMTNTSQHSLLSKFNNYGNDVKIQPDGMIVSGSSISPIEINWAKEINSSNYNFDRPITYDNLSVKSCSLHFGNFNDDGFNDILRQGDDHTSNGSVYLYLSNGDGTFQKPTYPIPYDHLNTKLCRLLVSDFNGDGFTDILRQGDDHTSNGSVYLYLSNGDGTFQKPTYPIPYDHLNTKLCRLHVSDFNGDGYSDILRQGYDENTSNGSVYLYLSNGDGTFQKPISPIPHDNLATRLCDLYINDFNGDGFSDILRQGDDHTSNGSIYLYLSNDDGTLQKPTYPIPYDNLSTKLCRLYVSDFNGDGLSDILRQTKENTSNGSVSLYLSSGEGTFQKPTYPIPYDNLSTSQCLIRIGDFDGDGISDILRQGREKNPNGSVSLYLSRADGSFQKPLYPIPYDGLSLNLSIVSIFDFNGDGRCDILNQPDTTTNGYITIYSQKSNSSFLMDRLKYLYRLKTFIEYTNSSKYKNTLLPFILHPVKKITTDSGTGVISINEYDYAGGLYDYPTREFRGFKTVTQTNPNGTVAISTFHQDEYLKGRQEKIITKESLNGPKISEETFTWGETNLAGKSKFIHLLTKNSKVYENNLVTVETQSDNTYTEKTGTGFWYLQSSTTKSISHPSDESITQTTDYENFGEWLWRPTSESITGSKSGKVRETISVYENGTGNLFKKEMINTTGANAISQYAYDSFGNVLKEWDANHSNTATDPYTEYIYDTATQTYPVKVINPLGHTAESTYDYRYGAEKTITGANGHTTTNHFDPFGRVIQTDTPDGGQTFIEYKDDVIPTWVRTRQKVSVTEYIESYEYFDGLGRSLQAVTKSAPSTAGVDQYVVSKTFYDDMGRSYYAVGPFYTSGTEYLNWNAKPVPTLDYPYSLTTYDIRGRVKKMVSPDNGNREIISLFDYSGLSTTVTDPDGHKKTEEKDTLGRTIKVIEHALTEDAITHYEHNAAGDLTVVKNALWSPANDNKKTKTEISYNTLGQKIKMIGPDMGEWSYAYDPSGNMISQTDNKKQATTFKYDVLNRLEKKTYPAGTTPAAVTYRYDDTLKTENAIGKLCVVSNTKVTTTTNAYDVMGRTLSITKDIAGQGAKTTESVYDIAGRVKSVVYPNTGPKDYYRVDTFFYPGTTLVNEVKDDKGALISKFSAYNAAGKIGKIEHGNGVTTTHLYDDLSLRLTAIETKDGAGTLIQNKEYTYSAAGDIESINDRAKFVTHQYKYDHLHRLREETSTGIEKFQAMVLDFEYDDANLNAPLHAPKAVTQNGVAHAFTYDANGNMTDGWDLADPKNIVKRTIGDYTPDNMPGKVVYGADTISLTYDGGGKRAVKTTPAGATLYYFNLYEKKKDTDYNYVFAGNLRVAMVKQKAVSNEKSVVYFHKDHLGSTNVTTDYLGKVQHSSTYLPYGGTREESGVTDSGYMFTDQEKDVEFGLYNYDARLYDPVIGRFIVADSVLPDLSNPKSRHRFDPQMLDRYTYCRNNPLKYVDPDGNVLVLAPVCIWATYVMMTPDLERDLVFAMDNLERREYFAASLDLISAAFPGASGGGRLSKPIKNFFGKIGDSFGKGGRSTLKKGSDEYITFYHATSKKGAESIRAKGIDLKFSNDKTDFGKGFYATTIRSQAQRWNKTRLKNKGEILEFRVSQNSLNELKHLDMNTKTRSSLGRFFRHNRKAGRLHSYDIVSGPMLGNPSKYLKGYPMSSFGQQTAFYSRRSHYLLFRGLQ